MLSFAIASVEIKRYEDGELKVLAHTPELNGEIPLDASAISNLIHLLNHVKDTMSGKKPARRERKPTSTVSRSSHSRDRAPMMASPLGASAD